MDANIDNEDVGNNTIVLRDDGFEEYAEILDVIDENFWGVPQSVNSLSLKL